jgi:hypothetical protein
LHLQLICKIHNKLIVEMGMTLTSPSRSEWRK